MPFETRTDYSTGGTTTSVALVDVNGDNRLDIVSTGIGSNSVAINFGRGDGSFGTSTNYAVGMTPLSVAVQDVNRDNVPDIVTANYSDSNVSVIIGHSDGTFDTRADYAVAGTPYSVALADINGDSQLDIVTANFSDSNNVSVLLGQNDGTFDNVGTYTAGRGAASVVVKDVNNDGRIDVITANLDDGNVSVLFGGGDGTFSGREDYSTASGPISVALADLNGDGQLDIVTANANSNSVTVLLGQGDGTFSGRLDYSVGTSPYSVALQDVNGDNRIDIVAANAGDNNVSVLLGQIDNSFVLSENVPVSSTPYSVALGDVNGDSRLDIVTGGDGGISVSLAQTTTYTLAVSPSSVAEGNTGSGNELTYTVTRTGDISQPGSVNVYFTGEATFGTDYTSTVENYGTVSFLANENSKTFTVTTTPDTTTEFDETVTAEIYFVQGGGLIGAENVATATITNDDPGSLYAITVSPVRVAEGDTGPGNTMTYTVTRSGDVSQAGSVDVNFGGRATFGSDYTSTVANGGTISFLANETSKTFTVTTTPDLEIEQSESVIATISNIQGGGSFIDDNAFGRIINDDNSTRFAIAVSPASAAEGDTGSGNTLTYTVTRSGDTSGESYLSFSFSGTATYGTDYTSAVGENGGILFQPGETTKTFTVTTTPDATIESSETVTATIGIPTPDEFGYFISATGTITNDDGVVTPQPQPQPDTPPQPDTQPQPQPPVTQGTSGNDVINGGTGNNTLIGGAGADQITATPLAGEVVQVFGGSAVSDPNDGADQISVSGGGSGTLYGNGGDDLIVFTAAGPATIFGGLGAERIEVTNNAANLVYGGTTDGDTITIRGDGANTVFGGSSTTDPNDGSDTITVQGNGNNQIYANGGDDRVVFTGTGNNTVFGGVGNDTIVGGSGNDRIVAGPGSNVVTGGAGADRFVHTSGGQDIITDFSFAQGDRIQLGGQPYAFTQTSDGNAAILVGQSGVIVLQGVAPGSLSDAFFD